ncbi:MAG: 2-amino-4-oxopentanoate thiolase subunit OrtA [Tissierellia bacterium]|nr:2-amino-4-oxopentanoate thiolase subunit OrtA [Tissierellia bacterium]
MKAKKGDWVRIHSIILPAGERAGSVPEDTANVPLELWHKGFLLNDEAEIGDQVKVETYIGREVEGELLEIAPAWKHDFGEYVPEIAFVGKQAKEILAKED